MVGTVWAGSVSYVCECFGATSVRKELPCKTGTKTAKSHSRGSRLNGKGATVTDLSVRCESALGW